MDDSEDEEKPTKEHFPAIDATVVNSGRKEPAHSDTETRRRVISSFEQNERFELIREIGAGGMGVVFEAVDRQQDTRIALKTMQRLVPAELYRFKKEFRSLTNIVHPNLVRLYELFSDGREWFYTMELVEGVDFLTWVRGPEIGETANVTSALTTAPNDTGELRKFDRLRQALLQLVNGVQALHRNGKLHRDIKPKNILVRGDGRVILLDFGLIKDVGDGEESTRITRDQISQEYNTHSIATDGTVAGSIRYMAPEQASGGSLTEACDWYALGVMLFEALTGRRPFDGSDWEILIEKQRRDPPRPSEFVSGLPVDLESLCHILLSRNPADRMKALALLNELKVSTSIIEEDPRPDELRLPFIGRDRYLEKMQNMFADTEGGRSAMLHLHGRSGAGKSALANRFLHSLGEIEGNVVLAGRCYEQESVPYKALDSLVDSLCRHLLSLPIDAVRELMPPNIAALGRVFQVLARVDAVRTAPPVNVADPFKLRRLAFDALAELLRRLGDRYRVVVYIDDLQWGDADSAVFLRDLIESRTQPRMLFVASYRSEYRDHSPCLLALPGVSKSDAAGVKVEELEVGPLSVDEAQHLALALLHQGGNQSDAKRIAVESGGNPYFVYELASLANFEVCHTGSETELTQIDLDHALWSRVQGLPLDSRQLLETLAVSGRPIRLRNLFEAAGIHSSGQPGIALLRAGHLIRRSGPGLDDEVESFHDRIRESIIAHLDQTLLQRHHLGLAQSLEKSSDTDPETIAIHYHGAGEVDLAGHFYEEAAELAATALAFDRAAKLYRETISLRSLDPERERKLTIKLADALGNAGRGAESAAAYLAASEGLNGDEAFRLRQRAGYQYCVAGHIDKGRECFRGVLDHLRLKLPATRKAALVSLIRRRLLLMIRGTRFRRRGESEIPRDQLERIDLSWAVAGSITVIDPIPAADFQTHNLLLALKAGEPFRVARALAWEASHTAMLGQRFRSRVERLLKEASGLAMEINEPMVLGTVHLARSVAAFFLGDFLTCRTFGDRAAQLFRQDCVGATWELDQSQAFSFWACYFLGDIANLAERQESLLAAARERGAHLAESQLSTFGGPFVWLAQDNPAKAKAALESSTSHWQNVEYQVYHYTALTAKTQIALYEGQAAHALKMIEEEWPMVAGALLLHVELVKVYMSFLRARCALSAIRLSHDPSRALDIARRDARTLSGIRPMWGRAAGHQINAALAYREGLINKAVLELDQAIVGFDKEQFGLHSWCCRYQRGRLRGGADGEREVEAVAQWMAEQGIKAPEAMVRVNCPGFEE